jgi:hypothetical protein
VAAIDPQKVVIIDTVWDDSQREGGRVLAAETDKAFAAIAPQYDWCFYIQGDEVLHEQYLSAVQAAMEGYANNKQVDGLLFSYRHFYGSYDYVANSSRWYRHEIRVVRNNKNIFSYRDAQGFRKGNNKKLRVKAVDAWIHHYGWVREPGAMQAKYNNFGRYWKGDSWAEDQQKTYSGPFDYSLVDSLERYTGTHPQVMQARIARMNWQFDRDLSYNRLRLKDRLKNLCERLFGFRPFDYKNYKKI